MARNTPNPVQQYRGTTAQHANYAGAAGEITVDTTKKTVVVQDGVTKGGTPLAKEAVKLIAGEAITITGGTLAGDNTIAAKIGSTGQRGVLQVGENLQASNGVVSSLAWTAEVEELDASNSDALSDDLHDAAFVNVTGENTSVVGRAIGELAWTLLPVRAAGFQLLDGSLIYSTGIYAAFYNYMVQLKNTGEHDNLFITETAWQQSVTQYGVCGKFVLDTTAGTVRIPKVTGHVEGTIDKNAVGDLIEAGLPNITGYTRLQEHNSGDVTTFTHTGPFTVSVHSQGNSSGGFSSNVAAKTQINFDASRSSPIYRDDINTVQTQSIKGYLYIIVGTYAKSDLQVNIDNVASDLSHQGARITVVEDRVHITETWQSGTEWYRVWSDGWIEQGGVVAGDVGTVTFKKAFSNTNYTILSFPTVSTSGDTRHSHLCHSDKKTTGVKFYTSQYANTATLMAGYNHNWYACGY